MLEVSKRRLPVYTVLLEAVVLVGLVVSVVRTIEFGECACLKSIVHFIDALAEYLKQLRIGSRPDVWRGRGGYRGTGRTAEKAEQPASAPGIASRKGAWKGVRKGVRKQSRKLSKSSNGSVTPRPRGP